MINEKSIDFTIVSFIYRHKGMAKVHEMSSPFLNVFEKLLTYYDERDNNRDDRNRFN